jgi:hypothetical protein
MQTSEFIKENHSTMTVREMATELKVPTVNIYKCLERLGCKPLKNCKRYTGKDFTAIDTFIKENYQTMQAPEIAKELNVKNYLVRNRVRALGLTKMPEPAYKHIAESTGFFQNDRCWVTGYKL